MNDALEWFDTKFSEREKLQLGESVVEVSGDESSSAGELILSWYAHIAKLVADVSRSPEERFVWGVHDFVAALYARNAAQRAMSSLETDIRGHAEEVVFEIDDMFREFTEPDIMGCIERVEGASDPSRRWWWRRMPKEGPVRAELEEHYGPCS